jgi:hypothetical protein
VLSGTSDGTHQTVGLSGASKRMMAKLRSLRSAMLLAGIATVSASARVAATNDEEPASS